MPGLPERQLAVEDDEPVVVLTLGCPAADSTAPVSTAAPGRPKREVARRARRLLASIGLARPPRLVSTFSLWRSAAAMREYSLPRRGHPHEPP